MLLVPRLVNVVVHGTHLSLLIQNIVTSLRICSEFRLGEVNVRIKSNEKLENDPLCEASLCFYSAGL